jgi:phosphohistidine swiveling domain-containing protein
MRQGEVPVVLVVDSLSPDHKEGLPSAAAVVTGHDGVGSHDLVLLRGMGIPVVTGCEGLKVEGGGEVRFGERTIEGGDDITVDGSGGAVHFG